MIRTIAAWEPESPTLSKTIAKAKRSPPWKRAAPRSKWRWHPTSAPIRRPCLMATRCRLTRCGTRGASTVEWVWDLLIYTCTAFTWLRTSNASTTLMTDWHVFHGCRVYCTFLFFLWLLISSQFFIFFLSFTFIAQLFSILATNARAHCLSIQPEQK